MPANAMLADSGIETIDERSDDASLIRACQQGDSRAFDLLIKRHRRSIYSMLHRLAPDWSGQHDDLAQETMIRIFRSIKTIRNPHAFKSWLNQLITNLFYDELRKKPAQSSISLDSAYQSDDTGEATSMDVPDIDNQPDDVLERKELMKAVNEAVAQLPIHYQQAIVLREFHGLPYDEIAHLTKSDLGTVKSRISRARSRVQTILQPSLCA